LKQAEDKRVCATAIIAKFPSCFCMRCEMQART
jgi:hypothetical protein